MDFDLNEDQRTIKRTAREFLAARYRLDEVRRLALEEERGFTDAQWSEIAGLGWPELADREQGLGTVELAVVARCWRSIVSRCRSASAFRRCRASSSRSRR